MKYITLLFEYLLIWPGSLLPISLGTLYILVKLVLISHKSVLHASYSTCYHFCLENLLILQDSVCFPLIQME